ncbi:formimidoylglutamate deiminase [Yimella sp. cx-51]|uniref:formimidoylglutamate deiminase n=1 Tax=Yimella sp. cx-51 TaxID=2770551 RepID=UPI00165E9CAA|nr:formimidoylglutamate deiminase [Yimella sp. cx-51]MBC9955632.1 formimidoylglutamate deiminase [Yimella sp. cx-51]QTH37796.1 formimidoylglutamate deiminase [Yimella sp. cx-51]
MSTGATTYWCEYAQLPEGTRPSVRITVGEIGVSLWPSYGAQRPQTHADLLEGRIGPRILSIESTPAEPGDVRLPGVTMPAFANTHSHAFHRALRGRTHDQDGTFWTWRDRMYHVATQLDPENYLALARATYAEMALAGITAVGEFHYVHHNPDGTPYDDPNEMGKALQQAARDAGIRLCLLDTCYLAGGLTADGHTELSPQQRRFGDKDVMAWADRVSRLETDHGRSTIATAMHSVRAVPFDQLSAAANVASHVCDGTWINTPLHIHLSEQPAENEAALAYYGRTPTQLLTDAQLLDRNLTAVHATHLTDTDIALLGRANAHASFCPTTERDLADGIGPAKALRDSGVQLTLGSDQHAVIDMFEEMRAVEMHDRLRTNERGHFSPNELLDFATGYASIGFGEIGSLAVGQHADFISVRLDSPRTAGSHPAQIAFSATAADVHAVVTSGEQIVSDGQHRLGDVGRLLTDAIAPFWEDA